MLPVVPAWALAGLVLAARAAPERNWPSGRPGVFDRGVLAWRPGAGSVGRSL